MGFFDLVKRVDINQGVKEYRGVPGAVLLDVRTPREYREGHIPGSKNVPLQSLDGPGVIPAGKDDSLFVCCYSGARSSQAVKMLTRMGYRKVKNIGGIADYTGKVEL